MTFLCISYSGLTNKELFKTLCSLCCALLTSPLSSWGRGRASLRLPCPCSGFLSTPSSPVQCWKFGRAELCWDCSYPFALQSPSCQPKLQRHQGRRILVQKKIMRHKALYNCSDLSNLRQENLFWFDIVSFLLFCSILNSHLEKKYAYPKVWKRIPDNFIATTKQDQLSKLFSQLHISVYSVLWTPDETLTNSLFHKICHAPRASVRRHTL